MHKLLDRLAADGEPAAAYESLRRRLILYFRQSLPVEAETLADTALDRLARRLGEGVAVANVAAYAQGIARLVLLEAQAQAAREQRVQRLESAAATGGAEADDELEARRLSDALEACLQGLDAPGRGLLLEYYGAGDGGERIRARQRLAQRLGISTHALRNRALRLRAALEACLRRRLREPWP